MSEHTPTPWRLARRSEYDPLTVIETADVYIADCTDQIGNGRDETNAAFIVKAVNLHQELVAGLEAVLNAGRGFGSGRIILDEDQEADLVALIAKAKETT